MTFLKKKFFKSKKIAIFFGFGFVSLNIFVLSLLNYSLNQSKFQYEEKAQNISRNFSELASKDIFQSFEKIELVLNNISINIEEYSVSSKTFEFINSQKQLLSNISNIGVLNNKGELIYNYDENFDTSLVNPLIFNKTIQSENDSLFITNYILNPQNQYLVISKKFVNKTKGVVFAVIPLKNIYSSFSQLDIGPHGIISFRDNNLETIQQYPKGSTDPLFLFPSLSSHISKFPLNGSRSIFNKKNNEKIIFNYKKIEGFNFYIIVGISSFDFLIDWDKEFFQFVLFYIIFFSVSLFSALLIFNYWFKSYKNDQKLSSILNSSAEGIYGVNTRGECIFCNKSALNMLNFESEQDLLGVNINNLIFKNQLNGISFNDSLTAETLCYRRDGSSFPAKIWHHPQIQSGKIIGTVVTFFDISEKKEMTKLVWQQANFDTLTSLANRNFFEENLKKMIEKPNSEFSLMFLDLDNFKDVNDSLGHHSGDLLLKQVAERLLSCVRTSDLVARLGGDEFTIIIKDVSEQSIVQKICEKIIKEISIPFEINNHNVTIGVSIGVTVFPDDSSSLENLLQNADKAMYVSKEIGKNTFSFFTKQLDLALKNKIEIFNDLKDAISNNSFDIYIQPIFDIDSNEVIKGEVLIRWNHPTKGFINPNDFISIAEKTGLINQIGDIVFKKSLNWLSHYYQTFHKNFQLTINVSPLQFRDTNLVSNWKKLLQLFNIPPNSIIIEITEGILIDESFNFVDIIQELHQLGIRIAIDDFGTGYSAMSYLYKYEIDFIKIDRSFISNLSIEKNAKITKTLVSMAHNLGIEIIAEGIENQNQLDFLKDINCHFGQGFFFSKPIPPSQFEEKFLTSKIYK